MKGCEKRMKTRTLYMVVDNLNDELPSAIGTADTMMEFLCVKKSRFYELLKITRSDKLKYLVFKLDSLERSEHSNLDNH